MQIHAGKVKVHSLVLFISLAAFYFFQVASIVSAEYGVTNVRQIAFVSLLTLSLFLKPANIFILITATIPLAEIARIDNSSFTLLPFLAFLLMIKVLLSKKFNILTIFPLLLCSIVSFISEIIHWNSFLTTAIFLMTWLIPVFSSCIKEEIVSEISVIMEVFMFSALISAFGSYFFPNAAYIISGIATEYYRMVGFSNAWSFGIDLVVAASFALLLYSYKKKFFIIYFSTMVVCIYFAILSGTFSILVDIFIVLIFAARLLYGKSKWLILMLLPIVIGAALFIYMQMKDIRGEVTDNGRFEIWQFYTSQLLSNWDLFLIGTGGGKIASYAYEHGMYTAHNMFLELFFELGAFGLMFWFWYIYNLLRNTFARRTTLVFALPILLYLCFTLTQGGGTSYSLSVFISIFLCMSTAQSVEKTEESTKTEIGNIRQNPSLEIL